MRVFISRELSPDSDFARILTEKGWTVRGFSLLTLAPLPFVEPLPAADWVFFYSQNAARFFFENARFDDFSTAVESKKWAAIGPATGSVLTKFIGRKPDFTGTGDPAATAELFRKLAAGQSVVFPCARRSRHSIREILGDSVRAIPLEIYENAPLADPPRLDDDVLALTSPMNAEAYFSKFGLQTGQKAVAIGQTTAAALKKMGVPDVQISEKTTERGLAEAVLNL